MIIVNLMPADIEKCRRAALRRVEERLAAGAINPEDKEWHLKCHETGCLGEWAVCKHYDCEWTGEYFEGNEWNNRMWDTAVGEVRATFQPRFVQGIKMYLSDDRPNAPYILVHLRRFGSAIVQAKLVGWAWQKDVRPRYLHNPPGISSPYYLIPEHFLKPMDALPTQT